MALEIHGKVMCKELSKLRHLERTSTVLQILHIMDPKISNRLSVVEQ